MKVIVAGSREFENYEMLKNKLDKLLVNQKEIQIVSGGCRGVDKLGERYAKEKGYSLKIFKANWDKYGKKAGPLRNRKMAEYANGLVAFYKEGRQRDQKHDRRSSQEKFKNKNYKNILKKVLTL